MRKCQGTQANVCISFPGMTTPFPRSSQTHKQPGSKQGPVSPGSHSLPGFGRDKQAAPLEVNKLPYGFLVSSGDTRICFCNDGKNFAVQREKLIQGTARGGEKLEKVNARRLRHGQVYPISQKTTSPASVVIQSNAARRCN